VFTQCGGFEIARTEERMEELRRRMSSARAWGIEAELVTPEQVREKVPFLETEGLLGAFWTPSVGVVDSLRAGTLMRERAQEAGALTVVPNVEVTGIDVEDGEIRGIRTDPECADIQPAHFTSGQKIDGRAWLKGDFLFACHDIGIAGGDKADWYV